VHRKRENQELKKGEDKASHGRSSSQNVRTSEGLTSTHPLVIHRKYRKQMGMDGPIQQLGGRVNARNMRRQCIECASIDIAVADL
jgi:hypothetical protein